MKSIIVMMFLVVCSVVCGQSTNSGEKLVMLPSPKLLRCDGARLWQTEVAGDAIYPLQVSLDHFDKNGCAHGLVALYAKAVPLSDVIRGLDHQYAKWSKTSNDKGKLYRVEPEAFVIQVSVVKNSLRETGSVGQKGMKQVIYLSLNAVQ